MNALPTGPYRMVDTEALRHYFADMKRCGYDIAYNSCHVLPHNDVYEYLANSYSGFSMEARRLGYPACIQIQATISRSEATALSEAQYHADNRPQLCGDEGFYASFASKQWLDYLKDLTRLFVQDYGYNWIVFDEPLYRVDIPGSKDRFFDLFAEKYPEVEYPLTRTESSAYLKVQKLKAETCLKFYSELITHAKSLGAQRVGIVPCSFVPTVRDTPECTLNPSCDNGALISLPDVDFVVCKLKPDAIDAGQMRTGDDMERSPMLCYSEVLSNCVGKPLVAIHSCVETTEAAEPAAMSLDFFQKSILSSVAAAPGGLTVRLYGNDCGHPERHQEMLCRINSLLPRFGHQRSPVGVVFSPSGSGHAEPFTYETAWQYYWSLIKQMEFGEKWPVLTFSADVIANHLEMNPQMKLLVLEEHSPLTSEQVKVVLDWWTAEPSRSLVIVGSGQGFSADPDKPGLQPLSEAFPGLLERIGLTDEPPYRSDLGAGGSVVLRRIGAEHSLQSLDGMQISANSIAHVRRLFGSHSYILFEDANNSPVITRFASKGALAYFFGLGSSHETAPVITRLVRTALRATKTPLPCVLNATEDVLWNATTDGYVIVTNCSDRAAQATISREPCAYWDVLEQQLLKDPSVELSLEPNSFRLLRYTAKTSKLYDVVGSAQLTSIAAGAGRADVVLVADDKTEFVVRNAPRECLVDGRPVNMVVERGADFDRVRLEGFSPGEHTITLKW